MFCAEMDCDTNYALGSFLLADDTCACNEGMVAVDMAGVYICQLEEVDAPEPLECMEGYANAAGDACECSTGR